jgi:hypothetical protein
MNLIEFECLPEHLTLGTRDLADFEKYTAPDDTGFAFDPADVARIAELYKLPFDVRCQLFGWPSTIQNRMPEIVAMEWFNSTAPPDAQVGYDVLAPEDYERWQLLLQLSSFDELTWGDEGNVYFWMREDFFAQGRFNEAWLQLQCY